MNTKPQTRRKALPADMTPTGNGFTATITTAALDRDGEVVIPQGMDATEYETNPVLFWSHDYNLPIGKCVGLTRADSRIVGDFEIATRPGGFEGAYFPEFVASLIAQGVVKGVSIGYVPAEGGTRRATVDDRKRFGDSVHTVYSKWKLLEVSVAPLQANPEALITAVSKGAVSRDMARKYFPGVVGRRVSVSISIPETPWVQSVAKSGPILSDAVRREIRRARGVVR